MLEARDRVGGRTWSRRLDNGATVEMGAEFILPGNTEVRALATELGLGLWDKGMRYGKREPRGGLGVSDPELDEGVAAVAAALADSTAGRPPASCSTRWRSPPGRGRRSSPGWRSPPPAPATTCPRSTWPASRTSTTSRRRASPAATRACRSRSPSACRRRSRSAIPSETVTWRPGEVRVRTQAGREVEADACVVAVPASVGDRIRFQPELPPAKVEAFAAGPLRARREALRAARRARRAGRRDERPRALVVLDGDRRRRRADARGQLLRRLGTGARAPRARRRAGALAGVPGRGAPGATARARGRRARGLGRRPVGPRRILGCALAPAGRRPGRAGRPACVRGRTHGRAVPRAHGGRDPQRAAGAADPERLYRRGAT